MDIKKQKLELVKNALQYAVLYAKTESETAEFSFLLLEVQSTMNESSNILSKKDIIDGNVIIADYLGLRYKNTDMYDIEDHEYPSSDSFFDNAYDTIYHKENLLYHYKWDWLEPVIDLLEQKYSTKFEISDDIKKTWIEIVNFIKTKTS